MDAIPRALVIEMLRAIHLAVMAHDGQTRKGSGHPYVVHPIRVAERVLSGPIDDNKELRAALLAAVLHDTLEDTEIPKERLIELFGEPVVEVVDELTQDKSLPKTERRQKMVSECGGYSRQARVVKLADRWDNMTEMRSMGADFIERYCAEARSMVENMSGTWPEAEKAIGAIIETYDDASAEPA